MTPTKESSEWVKPDAVLVSAFDASLSGLEESERRKMFGYPCAFVHGQMFAGLFGQRMMIRLDNETRAEFLQGVVNSAIFSPRPGMEMREYVSVPQAVWSDPQTIHLWVERAYRYASSLPPKEKKVRKKG